MSVELFCIINTVYEDLCVVVIVAVIIIMILATIMLGHSWSDSDF